LHAGDVTVSKFMHGLLVMSISDSGHALVTTAVYGENLNVTSITIKGSDLIGQLGERSILLMSLVVVVVVVVVTMTTKTTTVTVTWAAMTTTVS
jgi:hypothetical protein